LALPLLPTLRRAGNGVPAPRPCGSTASVPTVGRKGGRAAPSWARQVWGRPA